MTKYLFLIFFITLNVYANEYKLIYNADFASCDGIEKIVRENDPKYVTDIKISSDSSIIYKRVLFAYHSAHGRNVNDKTNLDYYALLLQTKTEHKSDDSGGTVDVKTIDWEHSLLSKIYLSSDINESFQSYYNVSICRKNYISERTKSIRDVLTITRLFNETYRMDSFIAIINTESNEPIKAATSMQTKDFMNIKNSPHEVKTLWDIIEDKRKLYIKNDFIAQTIIFDNNFPNYIIQTFNDKQFLYDTDMLENGIYIRALRDNSYIVKKTSDGKEFYMCALPVNKDNSFFTYLGRQLACFNVRLNKNLEHIDSLNDVDFIPTILHEDTFSTDKRFYISNGKELFKAKDLGNNMIELTNSKLIFDLRLVFFLRLGYHDKIVNDYAHITVHNDFSRLENRLIKEQKKIKEKPEHADGYYPLSEIKHF